MSTMCTLIFVNNPRKVYYGGELLNGRVELSIFDSKTIRGKDVECRLSHKYK